MNKKVLFLIGILILCLPCEASIKQVNISRANATLSTGLDTYVTLDNGASTSTTEADKGQFLRVSGTTFSRLTSRISANTLNINSNVNFRVGSAPGNETVTITNSTTGLFVDSSNTDVCALNALIDLEYKVGVATGSATLDFTSVTSSPSSNWRIYGQNAGGNIASTNIYRALSGNGQGTSGNENLAQQKFRTAGTLKKGQVNISTNTATSDNPITSRINGSPGTIIMTVLGLSTGVTEDTTHSDSISVSDLVNWNTTSLTGSTAAPLLGVEFVANDASVNEILGHLNVTVADGTTVYNVISALGTAVSTELISETPIDFAYTVSNLETFISVNSTSSTSSFSFRVGAGSPAGVPSATITSGTTGFFIDSTSYTGSSGDLVDYRIINGGGGSMNVRTFGILMNEVQPVTSRTSDFFQVF